MVVSCWIILWIAASKYALLSEFSVKPSLMWRTGETVFIIVAFGFTSEILLEIFCILFEISSIDNNSFLKFFCGSLWQLATVSLLSIFLYTHEVPKVKMICVEEKSASRRFFKAEFRLFKNSVLSKAASSECASNHFQISLCS